jgi:hypothetical protein
MSERLVSDGEKRRFISEHLQLKFNNNLIPVFARDKSLDADTDKG